MKRAICLLLAATACSAASYEYAGGYTSPPGDLPGGYGATPGGAKDIGYARDLIAQGGVPTPETITVEGLLSEHDLPTSGPACDQLFCLRPALGYAGSLDTGRRHVWLQLGMSSGLPAGWRRPPLDVVVVVDKSASMSIDMDQTTTAVARLVRKLREDDRVAIIAADDALHTVHAFGPPGDKEALERKVKALGAGGGFDIDAAIREAYRVFQRRRDTAGRLARVMVLSCGMPTDVDGTIEQGARDRVAMSFFGVLLGYSPGLTDLLARTPGGASYYLEGLEKVERVFDQDFDVMVTPLAYDLHLELGVPAGVTVEKIYGLPGDAAGAPKTTLEVASVFLSNRRGAIVARLSGELPSGAVATVRLRYRPEPALGFTGAADESFSVDVPMEARSASTPFFAGPGVRKAVALVNQADRMRAAATAYHAGKRADAAAIVDALLDFLRAEHLGLGDDALLPEIALVEKLRANVGR